MAESRRRLRVVHVSHTVEHGGAELALHRILATDGRDWDARLVIPQAADRGVFATDSERHVDVREITRAQPPGASRASWMGAFGFAASLVRDALRLRRSRVFRGADVIHANSTRAAVYTALALIGVRTPLVVHLRDRIEPDAIGAVGYQVFRRVVCPRADLFIANSDATAETIRPLIPATKPVLVIPSPIGLDIVDPADRSDPTPGSGVKIGMVARIDPWKGQHLLIAAFAQAKLDESTRLVFVGDAAFGHEQYLRELQDHAHELGLARVDFAGFRSDVGAAIDALDICVQYSTRPEPLGQNVLQYLARGKAVIAAREGGPCDWIVDGTNGLLVEPRSVDDLATALRRLVEDRAFRERLANAATSTPGLASDRGIAGAHLHAFEMAASSRKPNPHAHGLQKETEHD